MPDPIKATAPVVVFDFDGALFKGDLGFEWLRWLLLRSTWRLALLLMLSPLWAALFLHPRLRGHAFACCFAIASLGDRSATPQTFLQACLPAMRQRLFGSGLAALCAHRAAGDCVVIATAEPPVLVEALLADLAEGCPRVFGSTLTVSRWGLYLRHYLYGSRKVEALRGAGFAEPYRACYTDSLADAALIAASQHAVLVNFSARRLRRAQTQFASTGRVSIRAVEWAEDMAAAAKSR